MYNVEEYLPDCLESCINQTMQDIEIICVDDCSTDNSRIILEEYRNKDNRIKIINHTKNLRQGAARNTGMRMAFGEYIWFIDSDDYIDFDACQILYDEAEKYDIDILSFQALNFYYENNHKKIVPSDLIVDLPKNCILDLSGNIKINCNINVSPCCYIAKKEFIENFSFAEGCFHEDIDFTLIVFSQCKRFRCIAYTPYYYRQRKGSTTRTTITAKRIPDHIGYCLRLYNYIKTDRITSNNFIYEKLLVYLQEVNNFIKTYNSVDRNKYGIKDFYKIYNKFRFKIVLNYWKSMFYNCLFLYKK
ncbi:MAG: glycosyltransferase [Spirochaetaceae bacterium]|nr:glycosyltransferase [Spirochaetaceae bacterium]